jgi:hypothetical protein
MGTIAANTVGQYLISTTDNPVIINPGVTVLGTAGLGYGIAAAQTYNWSITNYGTVIGHVAGGTVSDGILLDGSNGVGGIITNKAGAYIYGYQSGIDTNGPTSLVNTGKIVGGKFTGALIISSGTITNAGTGIIQGSRYGVLGAGSPGGLTVVNSATINGSGALGVFLQSGGVITNQTGGVIKGGFDGIYSIGTSKLSTVINAATIIGTSNAGAFLLSGGAVTNQSGGYIEGFQFGVHIPGSAIVDNSGTIAAAQTTQSAGVVMDGGGYAVNRTGGVIRSRYIGVDVSVATSASSGTVVNQGSVYGVIRGVQIVDAPGTVTNSGSIGGGTATASDPTLASMGVLLASGGSVNNTGVINGTEFGIDVGSGAGTVYNQGTITSSYKLYGAGVALQSGGIVTNASGGVIKSTWKGVQIGGSLTESIGGTVINQGVILAADTLGDGAGVWIHGPGLIVNGPTALISGGAFGIVAYYSNTTVINHGSVFATEYAFKNVNPNNVNRIVMYPGASFTGIVDANDTIGVNASTLELGSGSLTGTLSGFGSEYRGFTDVQVDSGAAWDFGGTVAGGQTIVMAGSNDSLTLENPEAMNGTLAGFVPSDLLVLSGVTDVIGLSLGTTDVLTVFRSGNPDLAIQLTGVVPAVSYLAVSGATDLIVPCFAAGTLIRTPDGDVPVETIEAGMEVVSEFGGHPQVIWVGRLEVDCRRHPKPTLVWPIQIQADAFGPGLPVTDLRVSPDHSIYVNGVLVPARHLVNGDTIRQVPVDTIEYFHVELKTHDVIVANGLPAESYLDVGDRSNFSGGATMRLFPDFATPVDGVAAVWEAKGCAPLVIHGPVLEAVRARLAARRAAA